MIIQKARLKREFERDLSFSLLTVLDVVSLSQVYIKSVRATGLESRIIITV